MTFGSGSSGCLGHGNFEDNSNVSVITSTCAFVCVLALYIRICVVTFCSLESSSPLLVTRRLISLAGLTT